MRLPFAKIRKYQVLASSANHIATVASLRFEPFVLGMMGYNSALPFSTMKELTEKLIAAIPQYVRQMIELLRNPREFIEKIDLDSDALREALMFLALPQKQNKDILFGVSADLAAVSFTVSVLLLLVS